MWEFYLAEAAFRFDRLHVFHLSPTTRGVCLARDYIAAEMAPWREPSGQSPTPPAPHPAARAGVAQRDIVIGHVEVSCDCEEVCVAHWPYCSRATDSGWLSAERAVPARKAGVRSSTCTRTRAAALFQPARSVQIVIGAPQLPCGVAAIVGSRTGASWQDRTAFEEGGRIAGPRDE